MGFILVDRIAGAGPGRARGVLELPQGLGAPACMAAEAVGQLAAWIAIERSGFSLRPVAGVAGRVLAPGKPPAAPLLDLEVNIESLDDRAVIYSGRALASGREAVKLEGCLGPMLPIEQFDDPERLRSLHAELMSTGRNEGSSGPPEFPRVAPRRIEREGGIARAELEAPRDAGFYADHFPRRAVFPGTLLLDAMIRLAEPVAAASLGRPEGSVPSCVSVSGAKMRSFVEPGAILDPEARLERVEGSSARLRIAARAGRPVATAAVEIAFEEAP